MLQIIEFTHFRQKDMNQYIGIIHGYPFGIAQSIYRKRFAVCSFTGEVSYGIYDGAYLTWRISLTDDEIVTNRIAYLGKVCYDDFLFLFYLEYLLLFVELVS